MPLHALKGHSGVLAGGGGSLNADAIPPPTPPRHHLSYEQPPHASLYRVHGGGGGRGRDGEPTPQCPVRFPIRPSVYGNANPSFRENCKIAKLDFNRISHCNNSESELYVEISKSNFPGLESWMEVGFWHYKCSKHHPYYTNTHIIMTS